MYANELAQFISDANQKARPRVKKFAPHLLKPLAKAYELAFNDHVILYPPSQLHPDWIAGVYSQNPAVAEQYIIRRDENGRFSCTCPSFAKEQYEYHGRTICKHTMAVHLIIQAHDAQARLDPDSLSIPAQIIAARQLAAV